VDGVCGRFFFHHHHHDDGGVTGVCVFTIFTLIMPKDIKREKADWTNAKISMLIEIIVVSPNGHYIYYSSCHTEL
jgi:hypothetical protein